MRRLTAEAAGHEAPGLPHRVFAKQYMVILVYDLPQSMIEVGDDLIEKWGVDFETALGAARDNLSRATEGELRQVSPGLYESPGYVETVGGAVTPGRCDPKRYSRRRRACFLITAGHSGHQQDHSKNGRRTVHKAVSQL